MTPDIQNVEVFKTNLTSKSEAEIFKSMLLSIFPLCQIDFDLDDCDRVLRIEGVIEKQAVIDTGKSIKILVEELTW